MFYQTGGLHPVHLGDRLDKGERYKVLHKLGHGRFSTVWLARDTHLGQYVALKILSADRSISQTHHNNELMFLQYLAERRSSGSGYVGSKYISSGLFRHFWVEGPNGRHLVLVLPVYGPSISHMSRWTTRIRKGVVRQIALQATQGVAYLHSEGICHGVKTPELVQSSQES